MEQIVSGDGLELGQRSEITLKVSMKFGDNLISSL
jgi:hypothetical protein